MKKMQNYPQIHLPLFDLRYNTNLSKHREKRSKNDCFYLFSTALWSTFTALLINNREVNLCKIFIFFVYITFWCDQLPNT